MRGRLILVVVLVVLGSLVAALNWEAMALPVQLDLLATTVEFTVGSLVALVTATLLAIFLLAALLDRSRQLRQVSALERQLDESRFELERKRAADLAALGHELGGRVEAAGANLEGALARLEDRMAQRIDELQAELVARLEAVLDRVVVVRDELAADIAEVEDALLRERGAAGEAGEAAAWPTEEPEA